MYPAVQTLSLIDQNKLAILCLCAGSMICNYTWFFAAVWQGFKDRVYPLSMVSVLFWLTGDGTVVVRWLTGDIAYHHWYVILFSMALILTVACELTFLFMILKFGKKEWMPGASQGAFTVVVLGALFVMVVAWTYLAAAMPDPLYITYFNLANLIGPVGSAALLVKRGSIAGTNTFIWAGYTVMLSFWYAALGGFYGAPFNSALYVGYYLVNIGAAAGMTVAVARMKAVLRGPAPAAPAAAARAA
jgi:hypothetical protein